MKSLSEVVKKYISVPLIIGIHIFCFSKETLTNRSIVNFTKAGLKHDSIKSRIASSHINFDTSSKGLRRLARKNVPQGVIDLMLKYDRQNMETIDSTGAHQKDSLNITNQIIAKDSMEVMDNPVLKDSAKVISPVHREVLTNQSIVELVQAGFESDVIQSKITVSDIKFDTDIEDLKQLNQDNVPQDVIALMIDYKSHQIEKIDPVEEGTDIGTFLESKEQKKMAIDTTQKELDETPKQEFVENLNKKERIKNFRRGYFGFSMGPSASLTNNTVGSNHLEGLKTEFGGPGTNINLNFDYRFSKNIGFAAMWTNHNQNINGDNDSDSKTTTENIWWWRYRRTTESNENKVEASQPIATQALLLGPMFYLTGGSIEFSIKTLIGYASSTIPEIESTDLKTSEYCNYVVGYSCYNTSSHSTTTKKVQSERVSSATVAFNIGASLRFNITKRLGLSINLDYFKAEPKFNNVGVTTTTTDSNGNTSPSTEKQDIKQTISVINTSVGIGYRFD